MLFLRVDDYPGTKPEEFHKHNLENFKRFHELLEKHDLPYSLGVIPKHVDDDSLEFFANNDFIDVCLHGIDHDERFPNEFRDFETEEDVYNKITKACLLIADTNYNQRVRGYIPPHNVIDVKTVNALKRAKFELLFSGPGSDQKVLDYADTNGLLVCNSPEPLRYGRSDELIQRGAPDHLLKSVKKGEDFYLTLHWTWEVNIGLENLAKFLDQIDPAIRYDR